MRDIFYERMRRNIIQFYDENYCGGLLEIEATKQLHLTILDQEYDLNNFIHGNLNKNRVKFLTNVQDLVNRGVFG